MHKSIEKAETVDAKDFPAKRVRGNGIRLETDETRFRSIQKFRNQKAEELGIEGTVIATRLSMEKLASTNLTEEEQLDGLMNWQREILSPAISQ
jgi:hypothetical protein